MNQLREKMSAIDAVSNVGQPVWAENGKAACCRSTSRALRMMGGS
jgi:hypothetical protein